jgi:hypothetical protein
MKTSGIRRPRVKQRVLTRARVRAAKTGHHMNASVVPNNPKLFLSHAWVNKALARRVARRLGHRGFEVWLDEQQMQPGEALPGRIRQAIQSCSHLLVLLTKTSANSKWVLREITFARELTPPLTIVPLVAESDVQSPLLDETLGVDVSDTGFVETALDDLARAIRGGAGQASRDMASLRNDLEQLGRELPLLSAIQLSESESHAYLDAIPIHASTMHEVETFVAIQWDVAAPPSECRTESSTSGSGFPPSDHIAYATADLFRKHGLGYYVLTKFVDTCVNHFSVHNMFCHLIDGPQQSDDSLEKVCRLLAKAQQPQHIVLCWFVMREFERLSEAQKAWAVAHFVQNARNPEDDAIFTAFEFFKLMPKDKALEILWEHWVSHGRIGFDGKLHLDPVSIFFRLMNDAIAEGLSQFQQCIKLFRDHFRALARGRELRERLAAADILVCAQTEGYVQLKDLCEELGAAPYRAEWRHLELSPAVTSSFVELVTAVELERADDAHAVLLRLHKAVHAPR